MQTKTASQSTAASDRSSPVIQVEDLRAHFRTQRGVARVVDGANLTIQRGEIFGLAGESGCGKTTFVEAILQIVRFSNRQATGHVWFTPRDASTPVDLMTLSPGELRHYRWEHLSYVPQGSMNSLNPVLRIGDQMADGMTAHGIDRSAARTRIPLLLEKVGLEQRVARLYPHELSGGMKQRAIIATAIAMDPELIIADEPTTALDVNLQRVILETLMALRRDLGVAILLVSHDLPGTHAVDPLDRWRTAATLGHRGRRTKPRRLASGVPISPSLPARDAVMRGRTTAPGSGGAGRASAAVGSTTGRVVSARGLSPVR